MATVPNEDTAVAGTKLTAAFWNKNVRDAINFVVNAPRCKAYAGLATAQTIASGATLTTVTIDQEEYDSDGLHAVATTTTTLVVVTPGEYSVKGQVQFTVNPAATGMMQVSLLKNATIIASNGCAIGGESFPAISLSVDEAAIAGDTFSMQVRQNTGVALTINNGPGQTFLSARWVALS